MAATMSDIAKATGVSQAVVSLVMNDKWRGRVSPQKQAKIQGAAQSLGYVPNLAARALRGKKQFTIGVAMPMLDNPFYGLAASMLQQELDKRGYMAVFAFWHDKRCKRAFDTIFSRPLDGIIAWEEDSRLSGCNVPVVMFDKHDYEGNSVLINSDHYVMSAVSYLYGLGHRRIGFIGPREGNAYLPYCRALEKHNLELSPEWVSSCPGTMRGGAVAMQEMISHGTFPDAFIAHDDIVAQGAVITAVNQGIKIPDAFSMIGCGNFKEAEFTVPSLTTFDCKIDLCVKSLVDTVLDQVDNPGMARRVTHIEPELVERRSCKRIS